MKINRENLAWAAGLFEGEGTFYLRRLKNKPPYCVTCAISMTDEDIIRKFHSYIGVGTVSGPYQYLTYKKPYWSWGCRTFEESQAVIAMLWPWLGIRRKAKAKQCLIEYHSRSTRPLIEKYGKDILQMHLNGLSTRKIGKFFSVSHTSIRRVVDIMVVRSEETS